MSLLIITSTYNRPEKLISLVNNVREVMLGLSYKHLIINDGGCPIPSEVKSLRSSNLELIDNKKNLGKNKVIHEAIIDNADYYNYALTLDDDDILSEDIHLFNFEDSSFATIASPKHILKNDKVSSNLFYDLNSFIFLNSLELIAIKPNIEISFAINCKIYKSKSLTLSSFLTRSGPELALYDIISREKENIFINKPLMLCEYQRDGMTANFKKRLNDRPNDFVRYYKYLSMNHPFKYMRLLYIYRLIEVNVYIARNFIRSLFRW